MSNSIEKRLLRNEELSLHSSYEIGGEADYFFLPENIQDLQDVLQFCHQAGMPYFYFGLGANILFPDKPDKGKLFISLKKNLGLKWSDQKIYVSAGLPLSFLSVIGAFTKTENLYFTHLLPGCVGSAIYMNAKCYDDQMSSIIDKVYYLDLSKNQPVIEEIGVNDCQFAYKDSIFQKKPWLIVGADIHISSSDDNVQNKCSFILKLINKQSVDFSSLKKFYRFFALQNLYPEKLDRFVSIENDRNYKRHFDYPSCGSVFKNNYDYGKPIGAIVDQLGLKGLSHGGAMVSPFHGNMIVNNNNACASDVIYLINKVSDSIQANCGFIPEPELVIMKS